MFSLIYFIPAKVGIKFCRSAWEFFILHAFGYKFELIVTSWYIIATKITISNWFKLTILVSLLFIIIPTSFLKYSRIFYISCITYITYCIAGKFSDDNVWRKWMDKNFGKEINRLTKMLSIVTTNLDNFSLENCW